MSRITCRQSASRGMNSAPTAYSPGSGRVKPSLAASLAKNLCGICTRMPAPSPARGSAPTAPRCSRLQQDGERVLDDLVRLAALDVGDEADAAGILVERGIVEALRRRQPGIGAVGKARRRRVRRAQLRRLLFLRAHVCRAHFRPRVSPPPKHRRTPASRRTFRLRSANRRCGLKGTAGHWRPSRYRRSAQACGRLC